MVGEAGMVSDTLTARVAVRLELPPDLAAPGRARHALQRLSAAVGAEALERIRLLASEVVTNSVVHAGLDPDQRITVAARVTPATVHVEVCDPGPGFERPDEPAMDAECGRGLFLVDALADRWGHTRNGAARVWFEIDRA